MGTITPAIVWIWMQMRQLEDRLPDAAVRGILPDSLVTVVSGQWFGSDALELTYRTPAGKVVNELLYSLNKPDDYILAMVEFLDGSTHRVHYLRRPFHREPDFGVTSVNYDFADLLAWAEMPG